MLDIQLQGKKNPITFIRISVIMNVKFSKPMENMMKMYSEIRASSFKHFA